MYHNLYLSLSKILLRHLVLTGVILFIGISANAQHTHRTEDGLTYGGGGNGGGGVDGWGVALNVGYDTPTGDLKSTYKGAPTFGFSLVKNMSGFTFNATVGYVAFKPKVDTLYYYTDAATQSIGSIAYENYTLLQLYVGAAYNIEVTDGVKIFGGLNLGTYMGHYKYTASDAFGTTIVDSHQTDLYVAPKLGVNIDVDDNFAIGFGGKYNLFKPTSSANDASTSFQKSIEGDFFVTYTF